MSKEDDYQSRTLAAMAEVIAALNAIAVRIDTGLSTASQVADLLQTLAGAEQQLQALQLEVSNVAIGVNNLAQIRLQPIDAPRDQFNNLVNQAKSRIIRFRPNPVFHYGL